MRGCKFCFYGFSAFCVQLCFPALVLDADFVAADSVVQILQGYVGFVKVLSAFTVLGKQLFHMLCKVFDSVVDRLFLVVYLLLFALGAVVTDYVQIGFVLSQLRINFTIFYGVFRRLLQGVQLPFDFLHTLGVYEKVVLCGV